MRVLTWNINGVRTLPQYHPWNTLKTFDDILNHLEADIVCFQEMKSSRQILPKQVALPSSFDSFFSFPTKKSGYSGIAVYTRRSAVVPLKAEEGLSGLVQPRPPFSDEERISRPSSYPAECSGDDDVDYKDLDSEGRAVVVDLGLFVLISVYCPNDGTGTEERDKFKMDYHRMLSVRVRTLIEEGREVMVVGDLNASPSVEDHCEGRIIVERGWAEGLEGEEGFWSKEYRRWLRDWLIRDDGSGGSMVDIVRKFWPDRKGMYTCWNTKISARATNYGTRIDFILITPGLVPWIKAADIQPNLNGSDHCPVYVDLYDEITNSDGSTTKLSDVLGARPTPAGPAEPPRLAAKFWSEHKQKLLSTFFGKKSGDAISDNSSASPSQTPTLISPEPLATPAATDLTAPSSSESLADTADLSSQPSQPDPARTSRPIPKRKIVPDNNIPPPKKPKLSQTNKETTKPKDTDKKSGQSTLAGFFAKPKASGSGKLSSTSSKSNAKGKAKEACRSSSPIPREELTDVDEDADFQLALKLSQSQDNILSLSSSQGSAPKNDEQKKQQWSTLLAPTQAPLCTVHQEPAKEFTVNKPGPNKGKKFFTCSRPVGPGYDKGRAERLREHVDPQYKCDFFMWSSDARKEMAKKS
ncbi:DNase I-like protein [Pholiota conissans]|uniref:DNA-(apurinic or apyrimidinic site) endonuclease 2 n=1 Tax=Pholiota conissans TaxID=109636 RepID=A0A9P5Z508_9AGAR|nr:DNase I-like protein [Pholiota conissans]